MDKLKNKYKKQYYFSNKPEINLPDTSRVWIYRLGYPYWDNQPMSKIKRAFIIALKSSGDCRKAYEQMNEKFVKAWQERGKQLGKK